MRHVKFEYGFSDRTICDWASFCREMAIDQVFEKSEPIGGEGTIVEIDESKFGKRKITSIFIHVTLITCICMTTREIL